MKAILVIDMPKTCGGCPCMRVSNTGFVCQKEWRDVVDPDHIPSWCPLKPMPTKKKTDSTGTIKEYMLKGYDRGWNDCLEEISGENYVVQEEE